MNSTVLATIGSSPLPPSQEPVRRTVILERGLTYVHRQHSQYFNPEEVNSAIENIYILGVEVGLSTDKEGLASEAMLQLISHLLSEPCFDQLRTKEQLGYIVSVSHTKISQLLALRVIVQSNHKDPEYLDDRIELFLNQYRENLMGMGSEEFQANVNAVREHLLEKPKNLNQVMLLQYLAYFSLALQESSTFWEEINTSTYFFQRKSNVAELLSEVTLSETIEFYDKFVLSNQRKKFSSRFFGKDKSYPDTTKNDVVVVSSPVQFKRSMPASPIIDHSTGLHMSK